MLLTLATLSCLLPFVNKAFHIDDPLFIWSARQILAHPLDPFGFRVNWYVTAVPMVQETKNPPLTCYYLALAGTLLGWSEPALHLAFLLPAVAAVWGTFRLAQFFCSRPGLAAFLTLATPVFLVSSSTLMCDTMMLAFWVWALIYWEKGLDRRSPGWLCLAGLLIGLGALTKYFGVSLVPLLLVYSLMRRRKVGAWIFALAIPLVMLAAYFWLAYLRYDVNLPRELLQTKMHLSSGGQSFQLRLEAKVLMALTFTGGCLLTVLFFAPFLWSRRILLLSLVIPLLLGAMLYYRGTMSKLVGEDRTRMDLVVQAAFFAAAALSLWGLVAADLWRFHDAASVLLFLWIGGTFFFAGFVNWSINARSILPMAPAASILVARRIDQVWGNASQSRLSWRLALPLFPAFALGLWLSWSDHQLAGSGRTAANVLRTYASKHPGEHIWFAAHAGFQYYMEEYGFSPIDFANVDCQKGDILVRDLHTRYAPSLFRDHPLESDVIAALDVSHTEVSGKWRFAFQRDDRVEFHTLSIPISSWLSTSQSSLGANFYSWHFGPLPFAFGKVSDRQFLLLRLTAPWKFSILKR
jgi:4-amino-4-deoxy-L-arabinose transferase-like glycosyltransferase